MVETKLFYSISLIQTSSVGKVVFSSINFNCCTYLLATTSNIIIDLSMTESVSYMPTIALQVKQRTMTKVKCVLYWEPVTTSTIEQALRKPLNHCHYDIFIQDNLMGDHGRSMDVTFPKKIIQPYHHLPLIYMYHYYIYFKPYIRSDLTF